MKYYSVLFWWYISDDDTSDYSISLIQMCIDEYMMMTYFIVFYHFDDDRYHLNCSLIFWPIIHLICILTEVIFWYSVSFWLLFLSYSIRIVLCYSDDEVLIHYRYIHYRWQYLTVIQWYRCGNDDDYDDITYHWYDDITLMILFCSAMVWWWYSVVSIDDLPDWIQSMTYSGNIGSTIHIWYHSFSDTHSDTDCGNSRWFLRAFLIPVTSWKCSVSC
jgi:hypothetical protein